MYWHPQYLSFGTATLIIWLAVFSPAKLSAQTNLRLPSPIPSLDGNVLRDDDRQNNQNQSPSPTSNPNNNSAPTEFNFRGNVRNNDRYRSTPGGNMLRDDDTTINQTQLPWVLVSNQPNQVVSLAVTNKISGFLVKEGLTPVSCSTNPVVIMYVNNKYVACSSPTTQFPPGTYTTNIPDLEPLDK
ncbi:hypothetical protein ACE1B6_21355 [Aerosakkonemataceae cyanobacterium BLCC-F154]|uniref:Uncharacterized protein n=1 Tax=Floridaenema fluviatile BLCC-F154 TaxID=3153640 RepID=A0ABV4YG72_9CYAN